MPTGRRRRGEVPDVGQPDVEDGDRGPSDVVGGVPQRRRPQHVQRHRRPREDHTASTSAVVYTN